MITIITYIVDDRVGKLTGQLRMQRQISLIRATSSYTSIALLQCSVLTILAKDKIIIQVKKKRHN